jgi:hypothetical protein
MDKYRQWRDKRLHRRVDTLTSLIEAFTARIDHTDPNSPDFDRLRAARSRLWWQRNNIYAKLATNKEQTNV